MALITFLTKFKKTARGNCNNSITREGLIYPHVMLVVYWSRDIPSAKYMSKVDWVSKRKTWFDGSTCPVFLLDMLPKDKSGYRRNVVISWSIIHPWN
jgi:hypothetical protein